MEWLVSLADAALAFGQMIALGFVALGGWLSVTRVPGPAAESERQLPLQSGTIFE